MNTWHTCKSILVVRLDNMGDLLMSSPAIRALKETFHCQITVLTSSMAKGIANYIPVIDDVIVYDVPWVKSDYSHTDESFLQTIQVLKERKFDGAILFTVFSQNPLPAVLLTYLAGIPLRLAYCRENPYHLLTHWIPEEEPYTFIRHQVRRDLDLVKTIGAFASDERLLLNVPLNKWNTLQEKLMDIGFHPEKPWLVLHPSVSEKKREYPLPYWIETSKKISHELNYQVLLTGTASEKKLTDEIQSVIGNRTFSLAGLLDLESFLLLIKHTPVVISVNTSTIHIAAAMQTPVVVLYAATNPQHTPWQVASRVLSFDVPKDLRSRNEVLNYTREHYFPKSIPMVLPEEIIQAVYELLQQKSTHPSIKKALH